MKRNLWPAAIVMAVLVLYGMRHFLGGQNTIEYRGVVRTPRLSLKRAGKAFLLPLFAPLGTVFDSPIDLRQFKSDVVSPFLGLIPLVP